MHELILGGQKSGKSRTAEMRAARWLAMPDRQAVLIATAHAADAEMHRRIARHRSDRALRVPGLATHEEPRDLAAALRQHCAAHRLVVVDCLTLWLTQQLMPLEGFEEIKPPARDSYALYAPFLEAIETCPGPIVLVGNEIGLGVIPLGGEVRAFVDALGGLNQAVAARCERVTFMAAGLPLTLKDAAR